jgi:glycosyltransferase involved in cell wall biosynthesis
VSAVRAHGAAAIEYLIVVPVRFHRSGASTIESEGAFCEHLRLLRRMLAPSFTRLTIAAPAMPAAHYERDRQHLGQIDESRDGIRWVELQPGDCGTTTFWLRHGVSVLQRLWSAVQRADLVHSGISHNLSRPIEIAALLCAKLLGKPSICVVDMDLRDDARMNLATGRWSRKSQLVCRYLYDPLRSLQLRLAVRSCSLVLLKSRRLCDDYGRGRATVKYFLDAAYSSEHLIPLEAFARKERALEDPAAPLQLVCFGRLTAYKGVDRCLRAVALALQRGAAPLRLCILGSGEQAEELRALCASLGIEHAVEMRAALPYGPRLFEALYPLHLSLAAPLSEDTPRSALDALACGIPILAFDTGYYSDLRSSGAVDVVPWPSIERLAERIAWYAADKRRLLAPARAALAFARANTQERWLRSRVGWTLELYGGALQPA